MAKSASGSLEARALGAELRECRDNSGLSVRALAQKLGIAHVRVSRYEGGTSVPDAEEVASYLTAVGVNGTARQRLVQLAREVGEPNWLTTGVSGIQQELTTLIEFERTATDITDVSPLLVPGLLQTSDYARALMTDMPLGEVEKRVMLRLGDVTSLLAANRLVCRRSCLKPPCGKRSEDRT